MTADCLNTYIRDIQCKYKDLAHTTATKVLGMHRGDSQCKIRDLRLVDAYLRTLYNYVPFEQTVTYAYRFVFTRTDSNNLTIDIDINNQNFQYSGSGDEEDIVNSFFSTINDNTQSPNYKAARDGDTLYIYSYDSNASYSYSTTVTITQSSDRNNSVSTEELRTDEELAEITAQWNCLSAQELCNIINGSYDILEGGC